MKMDVDHSVSLINDSGPEASSEENFYYGWASFQDAEDQETIKRVIIL